MVSYPEGNKKRLIHTAVDLTLHLVFTAILAVCFYRLTGGWAWPLMAIAGGILIDIDHFFDYFLYFGPKLSPLGFLTHRHLDSGKIYVLFHSWELIVLVWLASAAFPVLTALASGMTVHLLIDTLQRHRKNLLFYSLVHRMRHRFHSETLDPEGNRDR